MILTKGMQVRVRLDDGAIVDGKVTLVSGNQKSVALEFSEGGLPLPWLLDVDAGVLRMLLSKVDEDVYLDIVSGSNVWLLERLEH